MFHVVSFSSGHVGSLQELLKLNLPEKSGEVNTWKFKKAHSILHKVREFLLFGWSLDVAQHLDVSLQKVISKKGFGQGCRRDAAGARSRIKAKKS